MGIDQQAKRIRERRLRIGDLAAATKREAAPSEWPCTASIAGLIRSKSGPVRPRGVPVLLRTTPVCSACALSNCRVGVKDIRHQERADYQGERQAKSVQDLLDQRQIRAWTASASGRALLARSRALTSAPADAVTHARDGRKLFITGERQTSAVIGGRGFPECRIPTWAVSASRRALLERSGALTVPPASQQPPEGPPAAESAACRRRQAPPPPELTA